MKKLFLLLTFGLSFTAAADETSVAITDEKIVKALEEKSKGCSTLDKDQVQTLLDVGHLDLSSVTLYRGMSQEDFKKNIPGRSHFISRNLRHNTKDVSFVLGKDHVIQKRCHYTWKSTSGVGGGTFSVDMDTAYTLTRVMLKNETPLQMQIAPVTDFDDKTPGNDAVLAGQEKKTLMFSQINLFPNDPLKVKKFLIHASPTHDHKGYERYVIICPLTDFGGDHTFVFRDTDKDGVKCVVGS